ncbi:MAG: flagellar export chaperone FlgN [Eubacteriales bacterium]
MKVKNLNNHIEHIVEGYKQQLQYYEKFLILAKKQQSITAIGDIQVLQEVLQKRSETIDSIIEIDKSVSLHKEAAMNILHLKEFQLDKVVDLIHPDLRKELETQTEAIRQVINGIFDVDRKNAELLKNEMSKAANERNKIQQHFEMQQAYLDRPEKFPEPRFVDKKK